MQIGRRAARLLEEDDAIRSRLDERIRQHSSNEFRVVRFHLQATPKGFRIGFTYGAVDEWPIFLRTKPYPLTIDIETLVRIAFGLFTRSLRERGRTL